MQKFSGKLISFLITLVIGLILVSLSYLYETKILTTVYESTFGKLTVYRKLCDSFFIVSVIYLTFGGMILISNKGGFDIFRYSFKKLFNRIKSPKKSLQADKETYYEYAKKRIEKSKSNYWLKYIVTGGVFFIVSCALVFLC